MSTPTTSKTDLRNLIDSWGFALTATMMGVGALLTDSQIAKTLLLIAALGFVISAVLSRRGR